MLTRIAAVLGEIDETRRSVVDHRNELLAVRDKLVNPSVALGESIEQLQATVEARLAGIFRAEHPPLWTPQVRESFQQEWQTVGPQLLMKRFEESVRVSRKPMQTLGFQLVLFLALGLTLLWLRQRTRKRADADSRLRHAQLVFEHPWAMAVLITTVLTVSLDPLAPNSAGVIAAAFIAVATLRIVQRYLPPPMILFAWGLAVLFILDRSRDLLTTTPTLDRFVFLAEMAGGLGLLIWMLNPSRIAKLPEERRRHPFFRVLYVAMCVGAASGRCVLAGTDQPRCSVCCLEPRAIQRDFLRHSGRPVRGGRRGHETCRCRRRARRGDRIRFAKRCQQFCIRFDPAIRDPEPVAFFENFGDSSLDFKLRVWFDADSTTNIFTIHSDIAVAVQQALEDAGIGVPFPQRDLRLISMPDNAAPELGAAKPPSDHEEQP